MVASNPKTTFRDIANAQLKRPSEHTNFEEIGKYALQTAIRQTLGIAARKWIRVQIVKATKKGGRFWDAEGHVITLTPTKAS